MYKENETVELKKSLSQLKEGIISLSSMLNKQNYGTLYFGINDDGKIFGINIGKNTLKDISHEIRNNLKPLPIEIDISTISEENKHIIKILVKGTDTPYSAFNRYYIRLNDSDITMDSLQLQHFFESKSETYIKWEEEKTKYDVSDIDEDLLIDFIRTANNKNRLNYIYKNAADALTKLELITEDGFLNNAGYYLFSNKKPLLIKEAVFPNDDKNDLGHIKEFRGNIFECINEAISFVQNNIVYKSKIVGIERIDIPEIPIVALREIIINSFAHASYAIVGEYNTYTFFRNSIQIYNPGSIYNNIDPIKFASGIYGSKIRNVLICSILFKYGLIESFGSGFDRTFTSCLTNNIEYKYFNNDFGFTFIFKRNQLALNDRINDRINSLDKRLLSSLIENKYNTTFDLSTKLNVSLPTITRHLNNLTKSGKIRRIGSRKTGFWQVINSDQN